MIILISKFEKLIVMSKSKNVNAVYDEYVQLRGQLLSNCNKMVETSTELNNGLSFSIWVITNPLV